MFARAERTSLWGVSLSGLRPPGRVVFVTPSPSRSSGRIPREPKVTPATAHLASRYKRHNPFGATGTAHPIISTTTGGEGPQPRTNPLAEGLGGPATAAKHFFGIRRTEGNIPA